MTYDYTFKLPAWKRSMKAIHILDADEREIGSIQPFYSSKMDEVVSRYLTIYNKTNYRFNYSNSDQGFEVCAHSIKDTLFKLRWTLFNHEQQQVGLLVNESKITTNPKFAYYKEHETFYLTNDFLDKNTMIKTENGTKIANTFFNHLMIGRTFYIKMYVEERLSLEEIYLLSLIAVIPMD